MEGVRVKVYPRLVLLERHGGVTIFVKKYNNVFLLQGQWDSKALVGIFYCMVVMACPR